MSQQELTVGGQAVIEGVMMRGPEGYAIAVRRADGRIEAEATPYQPLARRYPVLKLPILRGAIGLIEMMIIGMKSLEFSANKAVLDDPAEQKKAAEKAAKANPQGAESNAPAVEGEKPISKVALAATFAFSIGLGMLMFVVIPNIATHFVGKYTIAPPDASLASTGSTRVLTGFTEERFPILYNLISGAIRLSIIVGYIWAISLMNDVKRLFRYHGAEHKAVTCFELGKELTVENVRPCTKLHPRCGTTFIAIVLIVAIIVFSFFAKLLVAIWPDFYHMSFAFRKSVLIFGHIAIMPLVAGVCFELLRLGGKYTNNIFLKILITPGFWFQRLTVKEPDDTMLEVAIESLKAALAIGKPMTEETERELPAAAAV